MTIASEITRLQWAKADICTAIENKWVTVWNVTLSDYACCIDAIKQWGSMRVEALIVAWWWSGWWDGYCAAWGGWAWWVIYSNALSVCEINTVVVWKWWVGGEGGRCSNCWGNSSINDVVAIGGGRGISGANWCWWSWGGWQCGSWWWAGIAPQGTSWGNWACYSWWGGGWAWGNGCNWGCKIWWNGWLWFLSCIEWMNKCYAWWGWGFGCCTKWIGCYWGWDWGTWNGVEKWTNATTCWSWGWGSGRSCRCWGSWGCGVVIIRYPTDWSFGINTSSWGNSCYTCNWYCIHCFTSNWTFTVLS